MTRYIDGWDRRQTLLLPECVDDYVDENNPARVIEAFFWPAQLERSRL